MMIVGSLPDLPQAQPSATKEKPARATAPDQTAGQNPATGAAVEPASRPGTAAQAEGSESKTNVTTTDLQVNERLTLRVRLDEPSGRYVYESVDPVSGEVERQIPPDDALRTIAQLREIAGAKIDKKF